MRHEGEKMTVAVRDTGIGLDPVQKERLFRPFTQADESTTRKFGGTGLGLVISKRLAGMFGGTIDVESMPERGSTFTLTIDAASVERDARRDAEEPPPPRPFA